MDTWKISSRASGDVYGEIWICSEVRNEIDKFVNVYRNCVRYYVVYSECDTR